LVYIAHFNVDEAEPSDANGLAGIAVGGGCPWAASH